MKPLWLNAIEGFFVRDLVILSLLAVAGSIYPGAQWYSFVVFFIVIGFPQIILATLVFGNTAKKYPEYTNEKGQMKRSALIHVIPLTLVVVGIQLATPWLLRTFRH
jgi:hypothetical protein